MGTNDALISFSAATAIN